MRAAVAFRSSLRARRASSVAVASILALGVAGIAATFALVHALLLRPLPYRDDAALVWVWSTRPDVDRAFFSVPDFDDFRTRAGTLGAVAGLFPWGANLVADGRAMRVQGQRQTGNLFDVLGAAPAQGRVLTRADED